jgi:REP element-mobilizing transposase RayT
MARPLRILFPDACYHVMSRGNAKALVFLDQRDYEKFLELLDVSCRRFGIVCYAFCLMPNHYHLVVVTPRANVSVAIQYLNGVYSQWWNHRHDRCGHVFQGRFKAQVIRRDRDLAAVCRYVVLNPVRAGLASHPGEWRWSSYRASAGIESSPGFLTLSGIQSVLASDPTGSPFVTYRLFISSSDPHQRVDIAHVIRSDHGDLGDESFPIGERSWAAQRADPACPRRETRSPVPSLSELLDSAPAKEDRNAQIRRANAEFGYRVIDIAGHLGLHPVSVVRILRIGGRKCDRPGVGRP